MVEKQTAHLEEIPLHDPLPPEMMNQTQTSIKSPEPDMPEDKPLNIDSVPLGQAKPGAAGVMSKNASQKSLPGTKPAAGGGKDSQMKQAPPG